MRDRTQVRRVLFVCMLMGTLLQVGATAAELKPGETLNQSTAAAARGMMPDPILHRFETGQHISKIIELPAQALRWGSRYNQATEENQGKYEINEHGIMIEKATGTWPRFGYGMPFVQIDPNDLKAPYQIMVTAQMGY